MSGAAVVYLETGHGALVAETRDVACTLAQPGEVYAGWLRDEWARCAYQDAAGHTVLFGAGQQLEAALAALKAGGRVVCTGPQAGGAALAVAALADERGLAWTAAQIEAWGRYAATHEQAEMGL